MHAKAPYISRCPAAGTVDKGYRDKYRSLAFNLRDERNPDLRARVLQGKIEPDELVDKEVEELASDVCP